MPRPVFLLPLVISLASGCATTPMVQPQCMRDQEGRCTDARSAALGAVGILGSLVVLGGGYLLVRQLSRSTPPGTTPALADRVLAGHIRWSETKAKPHAVQVTLRGADRAPVQTTTSHDDGSFRFPLPRKPGWYTVVVRTSDADAETSVWIQDRIPDPIELVLVPRATAAAAAPK